MMIGLLTTTATRSVDASVQRWTANGPPGAAVHDVVVDPSLPSTVYMVGPGVWRSTNAGGSWSRLTTGLTSSNIRVLAVNPGNPQVVLIGSWDAGVFRSTNGGVTWTPSNDGLPDVKITALAIDPTTPSTVYTGVRYQGAFKSTDGGRNWSAINTSLEGQTTVTAIAIDPGTPQTIFAGTYDGAVVSTNGGSSWSPVGGGLLEYSVATIAIDPTNSSVIFVGFENRGVYKSTDGGANWTESNTGLGKHTIRGFAIDPIRPSTVHLASSNGMYRSTDAGSTWVPAVNGPPLLSMRAVALVPSSRNTLYAGTYAAGIYKSIDGGSTWNHSSNGLLAAHARNIIVDSGIGGRLWATTRGGFWRSDDGGESWVSRSGDLPIISADAVTRDSHDGDTFYLGTSRGLYKTTNGGTNWTLTPSDPTPRQHEAVATHPVVADRVYAGNWTGLVMSDDGGETWEQPETGPKGMRVVSFGFDPNRPQTVYAGAWDGVFRSDDFGTTWTPSLEDETIWSIAVDPVSSNTVYVCTYNGVFKSTNGGASWNPATTGITALYCWTLAIDPIDRSTLYQGSGAGVFRTTNGGASWAPFPGLEEYNVYGLGFSPDGNTLYAGTAEGGVAAYTFGGSGCTLECSTIVPASSFAASDVYFQAMATPAGCVSPPTYEWDFGDNSPHSTQQNPSHTYASAGTYPWSMTVRSGSTTCTSNGTTEVASQTTTWYVPATAHAAGSGGTSWRTDFAAVNGSSGPANLTLTFIRYLGGAEISRKQTLSAGQAMEWRDVLVSLFGVSATGSAKGTICVSSSTPVALTARTYNQTPQGTYGQYMPALPGTVAVARPSAQGSRLVSTGDIGVIPHLKKTADFRSNLGVQNLGTAPVTAEIRLFDTAGSQIGTTLKQTIAIGRYWQQDDVFFALGAGSPEIAYATVEVISSGGSAWFYGSVVDNATGDPTTVPVLLSRPGTGGIAGVAHAPGAGGTEWRTDIAAVYLGTGTIQFQPSFTIYNGGASSSVQKRIPARNTKEWRDVLVSFFERDAGSPVKGTLGVPSMPDIYVTARTYNQRGSGTFGQYLPAVTAAEGFGENSVAIIPQLKRNASYRSNVGVLNLSDFEVVAAIRLFDDTGSKMGLTSNLTVSAHEYFQIDDVLAALGVGDLDLAYATIEILTAGGRVWAYGSVVDNATGDPTTIPALVP